jgi:uncharacterized protein (TIGR00266 family)
VPVTPWRLSVWLEDAVIFRDYYQHEVDFCPLKCARFWQFFDTLSQLFRKKIMAMDIIDYQIFGDDMQFVEIELDPSEAVIGEAGAMFYMEDEIQMETIFGDGSASQGGLMGKLMGAGKRLITGESMFTTVFMNAGRSKRKVAFGAAYPGRIIPMHLGEMGGTLLCQKDAFLCAAKGVSLGVAFQKKLGAGFFGGEGFILQKLEGDGLAFIHAGGAIIEKTLQPGQSLRVDTGCVVAFTSGIDYDIQFVGGVKTALFGGEGLFFTTLRGPGKIWLQSLPLARLANRIVGASKVGGSKGGEQGSVLGGLGNLFEKD